MLKLKKVIEKPYRNVKSNIYWNSFLEINDPEGISKILNTFQKRYDIKEIKEISSSPNYLDYICYYQDHPISIIIAKYKELNNDSRSQIIIECFCLFPNFKQNDYGKKIFKHLFNKLWEMGIETVMINIEENNKYLSELCKNIGFKSFTG